jgi:hypothetical protein
MKLFETKVTDKAVRMRFADDGDPAKAEQWVEFQIPLADLKHPHAQNHPLQDPEIQLVAELRLSALRAVRDVIGEEIQRLSGLVARTSR